MEIPLALTQWVMQKLCVKFYKLNMKLSLFVVKSFALHREEKFILRYFAFLNKTESFIEVTRKLLEMSKKYCF